MLRWFNEHLSSNSGPGALQHSSSSGRTLDDGETGEEESGAAVVRVTNLSSQLRDGVALLRLIGALLDAPVGFHYPRPQLMWHAMHNASLVLRVIQQHTAAQVTLCSSRDIVAGNKDALLVLLRFLRARYVHLVVFHVLFMIVFFFLKQNCILHRYDLEYLFQKKLLEEKALSDIELDNQIALGLFEFFIFA